MTEQIHKRMIDEQVKIILDRYVKKEMNTKQAMDLLGLKRSQFFEWLKKYKEGSEDFSIEYKRSNEHRKISESLEENIEKELKMDKELIDDRAMPVRFYNYSFIKDQIEKKYRQAVSLPTIIDRAEKRGFIFPDRKRRYMTVR